MASPGFGFSAGDFISAISLVKKLMRALNDTAGSRASYRHLIAELMNLDEALCQIRCLPANAAQPPQRAALIRISGQCQFSIETFLNKNAKFKETLGLQPSTSTWRTHWHKIQWALCRDGAIDELRKEISAHATTLNLILVTIQLSATHGQGEAVDSCKQLMHLAGNNARESLELTKQNHQLMTTQKDLVMRLSDTLAGLPTEKRISELQCLFQTGLEFYSRTLDELVKLQQLHTNIPPQVKRKQAVLFEDAHERQFPFHIEFISSFAAFQWLLERNFEGVPGLRKVKSLEYAMHDTASKRTIDMSMPWESIFRPGRTVHMSMVFQRPKTSTFSCPGCLAETPDHPDSGDSDIECANPRCRIWYRRVTEVETVGHGKRKLEDARPAPAKRRRTEQGSSKSRELSDESEAKEDAEDEVHEFRRVQIVHKEGSATAPRVPQGPSCNNPAVHESALDAREQRNALFSKQPVTSSRVGEQIMVYSEDLPPAIPASRRPKGAQVDDREEHFGSIFAKPTIHARREPSSEVQRGMAFSSNMSIDTDRGSQQSASHLDKASIFARVRKPGTSNQEICVSRDSVSQPSESCEDFLDLSDDPGQEVYSKSFYGWVSEGFGDSLLDVSMKAGIGGNEGYSRLHGYHSRAEYSRHTLPKRRYREAQ